jgi:hypothetical protein
VKEIPLTQGKFAVIDDEDYELVAAFNWKYSNKGYAAKNYQEDGKYKTLLMHRLIMSPKDGVFIDHIDGNPLNNKRSNLREVTNRQNCLNQKITKRNTSGYKGVCWSKFNKKWAATVRDSNQKQVHLGYFDNKHDAARMYNFWASDLYGEFARLNVIKEENE